MEIKDNTTQNSLIDIMPMRIIKWSCALTCMILGAAAIYYVPDILKNLYEATAELNGMKLVKFGLRQLIK